MSKETGTNESEGDPLHRETPRQINAADDVEGEEIDSTDEPSEEEDVEGYGHGV